MISSLLNPAGLTTKAIAMGSRDVIPNHIPISVFSQAHLPSPSTIPWTRAICMRHSSRRTTPTPIDTRADVYSMEGIQSNALAEYQRNLKAHPNFSYKQERIAFV